MCTIQHKTDKSMEIIIYPEGEEEESETQMLMKKPWGDTHHFCPVALESGVLWPGSQENAVRLDLLH